MTRNNKSNGDCQDQISHAKWRKKWKKEGKKTIIFPYPKHSSDYSSVVVFFFLTTESRPIYCLKKIVDEKFTIENWWNFFWEFFFLLRHNLVWQHQMTNSSWIFFCRSTHPTNFIQMMNKFHCILDSWSG